tara:strand:- start:2347 stop:3309 length:963 start_codon:yes stop_codon:yes gene_type:complete
MPRNVYFSAAHKQEQHLYEDIVIEALKIYGQEVYYLPRKIITRDMILNEDRESYFDDSYMIEMYPEDIEGFGGEGNLMSKFGLEIRDEATFIVAKRTWEKLVGFFNNAIDNMRPNEGDLIYLPMSQSMFEITFVEHEQPFYQLNNIPTYKLQCKLFEYNDEDFNTGIGELDQIETLRGSVLTMLVRNITGEIDIGTRLYQVLTRDAAGLATKWISGKVVEQDAIGGLISNRTIYLTDLEMNGTTLSDFIVSTTGVVSTYLTSDVTSVTPEITAEIYEIYTKGDAVNYTFVNDSDAQNWNFEQEGDSFIDFSENNPFGDPN